MRRPLVAGNWKMNGSVQEVSALLDGLKSRAVPADVDVAVFPGMLHVMQACQTLDGIAVGAQDCAVEAGFGAMTGETSATQLKDAGCSMVLVGHSERRELQGEDDEVVARKFVAARSAGLIPVLCVGETLQQREQGRAIETVTEQVEAVIREAGIKAFADAVLAYEPVWAIGTGLTATPEQAQQVHKALRGVIAVHDAAIADSLRILYGGSVKADNAAELFAQRDIDGGLVGGASLDAEEFGAICRAAGNE